MGLEIVEKNNTLKRPEKKAPRKKMDERLRDRKWGGAAADQSF